jgi:hypothetical protein
MTARFEVTKLVWNQGKMFRERARWLVRRLKRLLRMERRMTAEECYPLLQLSEAIIEHGRMLQSYYERPMEYVMVEISELAYRLKETPETIQDALVLLRDMGRADAYDGHGRWKLRLADTVRAEPEATEAKEPHNFSS